MLVSLGVDNCHVLAGSYEVLTKHILDSLNRTYLFYDQEKVMWNYRNVMQAPSHSPAEAEIAIELPVAEGGC